jgi:hypothetical protein
MNGFTRHFSTDECIKILSTLVSQELDKSGKQISVNNEASIRKDGHEGINY